MKLDIVAAASRCSLAAALLLGLAPTAAAQAEHPHSHDARAAAPHHHKLLLENESVRVLETRIAVGERTPVHAHSWPAALYVISWSDFIRYDPAGKVLLDSRTLPSRPQPGTALWTGPVTLHSI